MRRGKKTKSNNVNKSCLKLGWTNLCRKSTLRILARQPESPFRSGITGSNCRCEHTNNEHPVAQIKFKSRSNILLFTYETFLFLCIMLSIKALYTPDVRRINNTKVQNVWLITLHASSHMNLHQKNTGKWKFNIPKRGKSGLNLQ